MKPDLVRQGKTVEKSQKMFPSLDICSKRRNSKKEMNTFVYISVWTSSNAYEKTFWCFFMFSIIKSKEIAIYGCKFLSIMNINDTMYEKNLKFLLSQNSMKFNWIYTSIYDIEYLWLQFFRVWKVFTTKLILRLDADRWVRFRWIYLINKQIFQMRKVWNFPS